MTKIGSCLSVHILTILLSYTNFLIQVKTEQSISMNVFLHETEPPSFPLL